MAARADYHSPDDTVDAADRRGTGSSPTCFLVGCTTHPVHIQARHGRTPEAEEDTSAVEAVVVRTLVDGPYREAEGDARPARRMATVSGSTEAAAWPVRLDVLDNCVILRSRLAAYVDRRWLAEGRRDWDVLVSSPRHLLHPLSGRRYNARSLNLSKPRRDTKVTAAEPKRHVLCAEIRGQAKRRRIVHRRSADEKHTFAHGSVRFNPTTTTTPGVVLAANGQTRTTKTGLVNGADSRCRSTAGQPSRSDAGPPGSLFNLVAGRAIARRPRTTRS